MQRIVYFTEGVLATPTEKTAIATLNTQAAALYEVRTMNGAANTKYGETNRLVPCDFVAGTVPTIYNAKPVYDPANPPAPTLPATKAIVTTAQVLPVTGGGTVTLTVAGNAVTGVAYTAP